MSRQARGCTRPDRPAAGEPGRAPLPVVPGGGAAIGRRRRHPGRRGWRAAGDAAAGGDRRGRCPRPDHRGPRDRGPHHRRRHPGLCGVQRPALRSGLARRLPVPAPLIAGRAGGLAFGALLLVVAGTRLEPLRRSNPDFDLVGPGWVSVAAFTVLVVFHGALVAALAGRLSRAVPLLAARPGAFAVHAPLLLLVLPGPSVALVLIIVGVLVVLASRIPTVVAAWHGRRLLVLGRVALALITLVALPGFTMAIVDIFGCLKIRRPP